MRFPTFLLPLAVLLAAFSCGKTPDEPADPEHVTLTVLDKAVSCWSDSEEGTVRFRSDGKWQAETDETWISVVTGSGRGSGEEQTLRFRLSPNQTDSDRTGILTLFTKDGYQTILVTQLSIADRSVSHHFRDVLAGDFSRVYICAHRANTYEGVYMTKDCFELATGTENKELFIIEGARHIPTYFVPEFVEQEAARLMEFFGKYL